MLITVSAVCVGVGGRDCVAGGGGGGAVVVGVVALGGGKGVALGGGKGVALGGGKVVALGGGKGVGDVVGPTVVAGCLDSFDTEITASPSDASTMTRVTPATAAGVL